MDSRVRKYLLDIQESIHSITTYLGEINDFFSYQKDKMLRRAVEREFEIIGEAMNRIIKIDPQIGITSKKQIIRMRNQVIHGYDQVDDGIIWGTIQRHLPILLNEVDDLLE